MKRILIIFFIISGLISCNRKNDQDLFLGYNMQGYANYLKEKNENINVNFTMQKGYISYLYSFISKDAKDMINNEKISENIKKSKRIFIQIGNEDFLRSLEDLNTINLEKFNTQKELFSYYYFLLLEEIRTLYDGEIIVLSPYLNIFVEKENIMDIDNALKEFYEVANEAATYFSCKYIDIRDVSLFISEDDNLPSTAFSYLDKLIFNEG